MYTRLYPKAKDVEVVPCVSPTLFDWFLIVRCTIDKTISPIYLEVISESRLQVADHNRSGIRSDSETTFFIFNLNWLIILYVYICRCVCMCVHMQVQIIDVNVCMGLCMRVD